MDIILLTIAIIAIIIAFITGVYASYAPRPTAYQPEEEYDVVLARVRQQGYAREATTARKAASDNLQKRIQDIRNS